LIKLINVWGDNGCLTASESRHQSGKRNHTVRFLNFNPVTPDMSVVRADPYLAWSSVRTKKCVTATAASNPIKMCKGLLYICAGWKKLGRKVPTQTCYFENRVCGCLRKKATTGMLLPKVKGNQEEHALL
jgi:hypothetical protein